MKLTMVLLLGVFTSLSATTLAQTTIRLNNVELQVAFNEIREKMGYTFVYNDQVVKRAGTISVNITSDDVKQILDKCLEGTSLEFYIEENVVVILTKAEKITREAKNKFVTVKGKVVDEKKQPIPGVTVMLKGTHLGQTTNMDGMFSLLISDTTHAEFVFSFVGMESRTIFYKDIPKKGNWVIVLKEDLMEMDEVVVTGYQKVSRRELASAITQIKASDIMLGSKFSIDQMLAGQVAGMMVLQNSGEPGATPKIRIRGTSSIIGSKAPVWVLDGIILDDPVDIDYSQLGGDDAAYLVGNAIAGINPQDIETITVLKDASATAIYGVQAANGVIVVSTKKGKEGHAIVHYNASFAIHQRPSYGDFDLMNAKERIELSREIIDRNIRYGRVPNKLGYEGLYIDYMNKDLTYEEFDDAVQGMAKRNTDWYDILFDNVLTQDHSLSISGGGKGTTYYGSAGISYIPGTAIGSSSKRYTTTLKLNSWLNDKIYLGMQLNASVTKNKGFHAGSEYSNPNKYAYETSRTIPCYENGRRYFYTTRQRNLSTAMGTVKEDIQLNILNELSETGKEGRVANVVGQFNFTWTIWNGFKYDFVGSYSHQESKTNNFATASSNYVSIKRGYNEGSVVAGSAGENESVIPHGGILDKGETEKVSYTVRNTISYNRGFLNDEHVVSAMFASEIRGISEDGFSGTYYGWQPERGQTIVPMLTDKYIEALPGLRPTLTDNVSNYVSWIGSVAYSYKDKITLNGNIRMDGSNKFGDNPKYRFLPIWSLAAKYTLTREAFLKENPVLSYLSIRGSYGIQGNVDKASSPDLVIQVGATNTLTGLNESTIKYLPNPLLRWEKTTSYNIGLDFSLWDGRISGTVDVYKKEGIDMIMEKKVSQAIGMETVKINGGKLNNSGYEGNLRFFPVRMDDYEFSVDIIYSHNENKLIAANKDVDLTVADKLEGTALVEGEPLGSFYSVKFAGLNGETGYPMFYDGKGVGDYSLYKDDMMIKKSGVNEPNVTGGFNLNFRYKSLRVGLGFQYALGGKERLPAIYQKQYNSVFDPLVNVSKELTQRWRQSGDEAHTIFPVLYDSEVYKYLDTKIGGSRGYYSGNQLFDMCDVRVAKMDNLRLRNLSVMYMIPEKYAKKLGMRDASVTFQTENLFLIADKAWNGRDPESGNSNIPLPKVYTFGLNVSF